MRNIALVAVVGAAAFCVSSMEARAQYQGQAQADSVVIRRLDVGKAQTPQYQLTSAGQYRGRTRDWFHVVTTYDTSAPWTDELTFTYYILARSKDPQAVNRYVMFRGKVTYVNIERGREHRSVVYLHPSTLARYGDIERVAVVIDNNGKPVALESQPAASPPRWWEKFSPVDGSVLNRQQTPFAMINYDDYEAIKPTGAGQ